MTISKLSEELKAVKNSLRDKEACMQGIQGQLTAAWCSLQEKETMINKLSNDLEAAKKTSDMTTPGVVTS